MALVLAVIVAAAIGKAVPVRLAEDPVAQVVGVAALVRDRAAQSIQLLLVNKQVVRRIEHINKKGRRKQFDVLTTLPADIMIQNNYY